MMTASELETRVMAAEAKADKAAEVALAALAVNRNMHTALEKSHEQMGEMLAASRQMARLAESLAQTALGNLPRTRTPAPVTP